MAAFKTPLTEALEAYGIDPLNTPQETLVEHTKDYISIDQFIRDDAGETVLNDEGDDLLRTRVHRPHPWVK
ncbi:hypothetical protein HMPREF3159_03415 [Brachybacterium sp. HMSC06H03]|uniref:hypothetical protein n=1 Tax=Brachybacterium sp. HMSC06H03 TaxID=1581127 RepID=UPI0008A12A96|nr:hypothetical protein [Brachybacterium sp. HMSC06H03]OFT62574.1 hypothetical protein HMPREF3159_03415 [Brachybacterium sp. HMSC06H03]